MSNKIPSLDIGTNKLVVSKIAPSGLTEGPMIDSEYLPETEEATSDMPLPKDTVLEEDVIEIPEVNTVTIMEKDIEKFKRLMRKLIQFEGTITNSVIGNLNLYQQKNKDVLLRMEPDKAKNKIEAAYSQIRNLVLNNLLSMDENADIIIIMNYLKRMILENERYGHIHAKLKPIVKPRDLYDFFYGEFIIGK